MASTRPRHDTTKQLLDAAPLRQLAVEGDVDPRIVRKALRGEMVRGMAGHRIRRVLREHGLLHAEST